MTKNIAKYALISLLGLSLDLLTFHILITTGLYVVYANFIASMLAFLSLWALSALTLFKTRLHFFKFIIIFFYQTLSILGFSWIIGVIHEYLVTTIPKSTSAITAKILTLPFSFLLNYWITKTLSVMKLPFKFRNQGAKLAQKKCS